MRPIAQLYCKKLSVSNVGAFLDAEPEHIGWQINWAKLDDEQRRAAVEESRKLSGVLNNEGVVSVFLIHPSEDSQVMIDVLDQVRPNIFLASAARDLVALQKLHVALPSIELMVPVGIPTPDTVIPNYDPIGEAIKYQAVAQWLTTDTINPTDSQDRFGCSGKTSNFEIMASLVNATSAKVVVAGGLNPDNVPSVWELCKPVGFDAHTSVCTDGLPDRDKAREFVKAVHALS